MDRLAFWGYNTDAAVTRVNMGLVRLRSSNEIRLRVKNTSSQYAAHNVTVTIVDAATGTTVGPDAGQLLLSLDGTTFGAKLDFGDLAPAAYTTVFWLRRVTPSTATIGAHNATLQANAASWLQAAVTS